MNPLIDQLQPYPFEKLRELKEGVVPVDKPHIAWSIGEPKHTPPAFVLDELTAQLGQISGYPPIAGIPALRTAICDWNIQRYGLSGSSTGSLTRKGLCPETQVLPVTGTREGLFSFVQTVIDRDQPEPLVLMPNPFYQIYEGAALLAGAKPWFYPCDASSGFLPDLDAIPPDILERCQLLFVCTPGNPSGAVMPLEQIQKAIKLADQYDFIIASDECYSELYFDEANPPPGLLEACSKMGRHDYARCISFNSLSKRSNLPGLRSGFAAGDAAIISAFRLYRTYHGCSIPLPLQKASIKAWGDEQHVIQNRKLYRHKFDDVLGILGDSLELTQPEASFYLWPKTPIDDQTFVRELFRQQHVTVLPGSFLARDFEGYNPGKNHIRMALVATRDECIDAAKRIREFIQQI